MIEVAFYSIVFVCMSRSSPIGQDSRPRPRAFPNLKRKRPGDEVERTVLLAPKVEGRQPDYGS